MTTRVRFALWSAVASTVAVLVAGLVALVAVQGASRNVIDSPLDRTISSLVEAKTVAGACKLARSASLITDRVISVLDATGEACRSNPAGMSPRALGVELSSAGVGSTSTRTIDGRRWRIMTARRTDGSVVLVADVVDASERAARDASRAIMLAMAAGAVVAALIGAAASGPATRRIERLIQRIRSAISDPAGLQRVGRVGSRDLDAAAQSVDLVLEELRAADVAQRRLFADAAHELRTPVTSIRTNAQLLERDGSLGDEARDIASRIARQSAAVGTLVSGLVDHAAIGAWSQRDGSLVALQALAREAIERVEARSTGAAITLEADDSMVRVDRELVTRAIGNLVDNALSHGAGRVQVVVAGGVVQVRDDGSGFDEAIIDDAFRPFARSADAAVEGSGLGLAFVDHVARAHGGRARIVSAHPAVVELAVPVDRDGA